MTTATSPPPSGAGKDLAEPGDVAPLLGLTAARLDLRLPQIVDDMCDLLAREIDDLGGDPQLVGMLRASIEGNVATICHILANDIGVEALQPTTAAVEYAARLAQRDVPLSALTRAYYLGQSMFLRLALDEVERIDVPVNVKMDVVRRVADVVHRYIDWILQYVSSVHEKERRRWWNTRATVNAAIVLKALRGDAVSSRAFEAETGYPLDQRHLAVVAWLAAESDDAAEQQGIDQLIRRLAGMFRSPRPALTTAADRTTAWAWIGSPAVGVAQREAALQLCRATPGVRVALGEVATGPEGFRRSHEQAVTARLVALTAATYRGAPIVAYSDPDVAMIALLAKDPDATRMWVREVLGPIAGAGEQNGIARATLAAYTASGENYVRAAEALGVHRNTVRQRVQRFVADQDARGRRSTDMLEVALALRAYDAIGGVEPG